MRGFHSDRNSSNYDDGVNNDNDNDNDNDDLNGAVRFYTYCVVCDGAVTNSSQQHLE